VRAERVVVALEFSLKELTVGKPNMNEKRGGHLGNVSGCCVHVTNIVLFIEIVC
jgi:hypothetical protein